MSTPPPPDLANPGTLLVRMHEPDPAAQVPVMLPIHQTTTFVMDTALVEAMAAGDYRSQYLYTRMGNPTVRALETRLAELHGAEAAVCTASGMAAVSTALIALVPAGGTVIADPRLYGVTVSFLRDWLQPMGRHVQVVSLADAGALDAAIAGASGPVWVLGETLSNPLVHPLPIRQIATQVHAAGARLIVDNTFAGPTVCRPLDLGADVVVESLSKAIAGHSDVHGGAIFGSHADIARCWSGMIHLGGCLDPHAAWLVWRGLKTLHLRMREATANATRVAAWLAEHPRVTHVYHPSRLTSADAGAASLLQHGGMLSFVVDGGDAAAQSSLDRLQTIVPATSLGGVESLASLPFNTSHRTPEARQLVGLRPGTVRLSVGIESCEDLVADLAQALTAPLPPGT